MPTPATGQSQKLRPRPRRRPPAGSPPGTLAGDPDAPQPSIRAICYGPDALEEFEITEVEQIRELLHRHPVTWVNVDGLGDLDVIRALGELFGLHSLSLEDVVHVRQRPKFEQFDDYALLVTQMGSRGRRLAFEQLSLFFGEGFALTFQERSGDCFDPVRERIRSSRGRIRRMRADYLAYALLDATIDNDYPILERFGEEVEALEDSILAQRRSNVMARIHAVKMDLLNMRRVLWPLRDAVNALLRDGAELFDPQTRVHLRDCYDHTVEMLDILESYREIISDLVDIQLSAINARTNETMRVLTIIATFFIPLGFVASLYGMNFDRAVSPWNMPELGWWLGYPFALSLMAAMAAALAAYFWRKGWFTSMDGRRR